MNYFKLNNVDYHVENATFSVNYVGNDFKIFIDISAIENNKKVVYELSNIRLYHENGFQSGVKSIKDLVGKKYIWNSTTNGKGEEAGFLYVLEHEDVTSGTIEFLNYQDNKITIKWIGMANVYWDDKFGENVPFETVVTCDVPKSKKFEIDAYKSTSKIFDDSLKIKLLNFEEIKSAAFHMQETRIWTDFNVDLKFEIIKDNIAYHGIVKFRNGKLHYETILDEKCDINIRSKGFDWDNHEFVFYFEIN